MPPFLSSTRMVESLISRRYGLKDVIRSSKGDVNRRKSAYIRPFLSIAAGETSTLPKSTGFQQDFKFSLGRACISRTFQKRQFLGCGDGEEGGVLSKVYEERRILGLFAYSFTQNYSWYSPEQLFNVVAAVDLYHGFVPWCQRSEITKRYPDGTFDAELEIGFKFLVESYVSHVELNRPMFVKSTVSQSTLFDHLINIWEFNPGPNPGTCNLYFLVDFKFQSPIYRQVASVFFKEVVSRLVNSSDERCRSIYGPGIAVHEKPYSQRA